MNTGEILDFYDDPQGLILKKKLAHSRIPAFVKEAEYATRDRLSSLHDDAFALVMVDRGQKLRKYACVDRGNTALSVIYFLENKDKLTKEAQFVTAVNLASACTAFQITPPEPLLKIAQQPVKKVADLTGTEVMPMQASHPKYDAGEEDIPASSDTKKMASRYVDVAGWHSPAVGCGAAATHTRYCLIKEGRGKYPIDSYGEVLEADKWFEENHKSLHPSDRREFCTKLAARANELGIRLTDNIRKYASTSFASRDDVEASVATRMQFWSEGDPEKDLLRGLMDKYASVSPDVFCASLQQFDEATGMNYRWDDEVVDPVASTYGIEKQAEWAWSEGPDMLREEVLFNGVNDGAKIHQIRARFGEELAAEIAKNPVEVFSSLPLDTKRIICHIVQDTQ